MPAYRPATAKALLDALVMNGLVKKSSTLGELTLSKVGEALITEQSEALEFMQIPGLYTLETQEVPTPAINPMIAELQKRT